MPSLARETKNSERHWTRNRSASRGSDAVVGLVVTQPDPFAACSCAVDQSMPPLTAMSSCLTASALQPDALSVEVVPCYSFERDGPQHERSSASWLRSPNFCVSGDCPAVAGGAAR